MMVQSVFSRPWTEVCPRAGIRGLLGTFAFILVALVPGAGPSGAAPEGLDFDGGPDVWVVNPLVRVFPDTKPGANPPTKIRLSALRGEYESAQLAVRAKNAERFSLSAGRLKSGTGEELPPTCVRVRVVGYVPVQKNTPATPPAELDRLAPARFPDPLLPTDTMDLQRDETRTFWLTFVVPRDARPGVYRGEVRLRRRAPGEVTAIPVHLRVLPPVLPATRHFWLSNWISPNAIARFLNVAPWSAPFWEALPAYAHNMAEHRQNVIFTPLDLVSATRSPGGELTFDFRRFDRWVKVFTDNGVIGLIEGGHVAKRLGKWTSPTFRWKPVAAVNDTHPPKPSAADTRSLLQALRDHLHEQGWLGRYVQHVADEPTRYNVNSWLRLSRQVHRWVPELRRIDAVHASAALSRLEVAVPELDLLDRFRTVFAAQRKRSRASLWFYTCMYPRGRYANRFIDYPLVKTRVLPWLARRLGCQGYLHWGYNFWSDRPFADVERSNLPPGDSFLVYPGKDGLLDSIRWETLRDGIEDLECLRLLDLAGAKSIADQLCRRLADSPTRYARDPALYVQVREAMLAEAAARTSDP